MAEFLVLEVAPLNGGEVEQGAIKVFYYEHYEVFNEKLFQESSPKLVEAPVGLCGEFKTVPGIYDLVLTEEGSALASVQFVRPVDLWWEQDGCCRP